MLNLCRSWLEQPVSDYVLWFALSVHEVRKRASLTYGQDYIKSWNIHPVSTQAKLQLSQFLLGFLQSQSFQPWITNKICHVVVEIAKKTVPDEWPACLSDFKSVACHSTSLCLTLMTVFVEEMGSDRSNVSWARRKGLKSFLRSEGGSFLELVQTVLDHSASIFKRSEGGSIGLGLESPGKVNLHLGEPAMGVLGASPLKYDLPPIRGNVPVASGQALPGSGVKEALVLFASLIPLLPISHPSLPRLTQTLFDLSKTGNAFSKDAITCLIELATKVQVPQGFESFSAFLGNHVVQLMVDIVAPSERASDINEEYDNVLI